jgi:hypothetical protein
MEDAYIRKSVTFSGMRGSRRYTKFAQRHIEKWIERKEAFLPLSKKTSYFVHIDKESKNYFTCQIELRIGPEQWSGIDEGRSVEEAIRNALQSLKRKERAEVDLPSFLPNELHEISA